MKKEHAAFCFAAAMAAVGAGCVSAKSPEAGDTMFLPLPGGEKIEMVYVAPGTFRAGGTDGYEWEGPVHEVTITKGFWLGKYEVTQKQWESLMGSNPSQFKGGDRPVETVSWNDCTAFAEKLAGELKAAGFDGIEPRLPTEAEWEYACRAGADGSGRENLGETAWFGERDGSTRPVGGKRPNAWGFYDMQGNVWEWCSDWQGDYAAEALVDPKGPESGKFRMTRGGSWFDGEILCSRSSRAGYYARNKNCYLGFRICAGTR